MLRKTRDSNEVGEGRGRVRYESPNSQTRKQPRVRAGTKDGRSRKPPACSPRRPLLRLLAVSSALGLPLLLASPLPQADDSTQAGPATEFQAGRLQGSVKIGPGLSHRLMRFNIYPDTSRASPAPRSISSDDELKNVVIYLESTPSPGVPPHHKRDPLVMEQVNETFAPHVLAVLLGSEVEFPNSDPFFHNVFSLSKAASFDLGRYPRGSSKRVRFDRPGVVKVFCHIHSDMSAVILVLDNPFFTVPARGGGFVIDDIPPGEYRVVAWHERARPVTRSVRIDPGQTCAIDFTIPLIEAPDSG